MSGTAAVALLAQASSAQSSVGTTRLDIPSEPLDAALNDVGLATDSRVMFSKGLVSGHVGPRLSGNYRPLDALKALLAGTGLRVEQNADKVFLITTAAAAASSVRPAATKPAQPAGIETVTVTAEKKAEDIQNVPIAVSAFSQKDLTQRQVSGGPDLVKEVPNLTFSKTNFSGYNLEIRGIGTQAISVTTDPAVAVAFNGIPFIRNHFFEQEFYDLDNLEVLRGPQGTLYGRNATAGVVDIKSAVPTDSYEAMLSADFGNYDNRRLEAMVNVPVVDDKLDLRVAAEWTKRDGYTFNESTDQSVDGRDLWSGRATLRFRPTTDFEANLVWEHFQEDDDRLRSGKQLCETDTPPTSINGVPVPPGNLSTEGTLSLTSGFLSQGCAPTSLYSPQAFQVPYGFSLPYAQALGAIGGANSFVDPYAGTTQSQNLRVIESALKPVYKAKNDIIELNAAYTISPTLTLTSQTGYNQDFLWSQEDYNRFNTTPGIFVNPTGFTTDFGRYVPDPSIPGAIIFCDPQLGCSDRLVGEDLSTEHAWQLSQEFRLASNFGGPFNFSFGSNYLHYETEENYYVFVNALTIYSVENHFQEPVPQSIDNSTCLRNDPTALGWQNLPPAGFQGGGEPTLQCVYIDPNPIGQLNNEGHNYFLSQNPYLLNSYATFGEAYYQVTDDLKLTAGLRWTEDWKHFTDIPSMVLDTGFGYQPTHVADQWWGQITGRTVASWTPQVDFTDLTLIFGSYAHGYKAGGANPPGPVFSHYGSSGINEPDHPLYFKPEYIDAFELGTKNTLLDGALTLNADVFFYAYKDYQISEIVDRTSINQNFNATVGGAEIESTWEPAPGLRFSFAGGYEDAELNKGDRAIDLMDRTAGVPGWMVVKPFPTQAANCILPTYVVQAILEQQIVDNRAWGSQACGVAYNQNLDPVTMYPYQPNPTGTAGIGYGGSNFGNTTFGIPAGYPGFNPATAPNLGEGFLKNLGGKRLPNAPPVTASFTAEYTIPVWTDWAATLHGDLYLQAASWARVFNDNPYDRLRGYSNVNLSLILNSADGWQVMGYVKNVFNTTAITGDFLNSDDSGLTTNVFLTDPRLFGIRITKDFSENSPGDYGVPEFLRGLFTDSDNGKPVLWVELGGQMENILGQGDPFAPAFLANNPKSVVLRPPSPVQAQDTIASFGEEAKVTFEPAGTDWVFTGGVRIGRTGNSRHVDQQTNGHFYKFLKYGQPLTGRYARYDKPISLERFANTHAQQQESHAILDFDAGKDVGLGVFGQEIDSIVSAGIRFAQFATKQSVDMRARPDIQYGGYPFGSHIFYQTAHFNSYHASGQASRSFSGVGPSLSWSGSVPAFGDPQNGEATFDIGANGALLFGRQKARVKHMESAHFKSRAGNDNLYRYPYVTLYNRTGGHNTGRNRAVPNLGGFAGLSWHYNNAKVSFGYRGDFFFGAMDGGIDKRKSETLGLFGPFVNLSIGLGG